MKIPKADSQKIQNMTRFLSNATKSGLAVHHLFVENTFSIVPRKRICQDIFSIVTRKRFCQDIFSILPRKIIFSTIFFLTFPEFFFGQDIFSIVLKKKMTSCFVLPSPEKDFAKIYFLSPQEKRFCQTHKLQQKKGKGNAELNDFESTRNRNKLAKARKMRKPPGTLSLNKFGLGNL